MSRRNSLAVKAERRRTREIRHVRGCAICGSRDVVWVDESGAPDPAYKAICRYHLAYAVATIFGQTDPPSEHRTRPAEVWRSPLDTKAWFELPSSRRAVAGAVGSALSKTRKPALAGASQGQSD